MRKVRVAGLVVGVGETFKFISYQSQSHIQKTPNLAIVDDGSGKILPCVFWKNIKEDGHEDSPQLELGDLVSVIGRVSDFHQKRQLSVIEIGILWIQAKIANSAQDKRDDPNFETLFALEALKTRKSVFQATQKVYEKYMIADVDDDDDDFTDLEKVSSDMTFAMVYDIS